MLSRFRDIKRAGPAPWRLSGGPASAKAASALPTGSGELIGLSGTHAKRASTVGVVRDERIETVRGLAVILMVAAHVIGNTDYNGLSVGDGSGWRHVYLSLQWLRMPLFTVVSGYVYDLRPIRAGAVAKFAQGKARRLLLPYLFVSMLFIAVQGVVPGAHEHLELTALPSILVIPYGQFWYLYALGWVFLVVGTVDRIGGLSNVRLWLVFSGLAILLAEMSPFGSPVLAISGAYYLLPYFLLGLGLHRFGALLSVRRTILVVVPILAIGVVLQQASLFGRWTPTALEHWLLDTLLGMTGAIVLLRVGFSWRPLARIGTYSYGIYLLHVFGTAGARIGLNRAGIGAKGAVFVVALAAGVVLPIVVEVLLDQAPLLRMLVLGKSPHAAVDGHGPAPLGG